VFARPESARADSFHAQSKVTEPPLEQLVRPAAGEPEGALVLLHGRAADMHDLYPLLDLLDPERRLLGVTPQGPLSLPPGGRHWYRLAGIPTPDPDTFHATLPRLHAVLDGLPVPRDRVVLGGFSQGAVMSWAAGLGRGAERPAAIMALSGFIPRVPGFELDLDGLHGYPVAIAHGTQDPVIPVEFGRKARDLLAAAGADVRWHETPYPHAVDPAVIPVLADLLAKILN
jgi:phospholipase/carboxylesterase